MKFLTVFAAVMAAYTLALLSACTVQPPAPSTNTATGTQVQTSTSTAVKPDGPALKADWPKIEYTAMLAEALKEHGGALLTGYHEGTCGDKLQFYVMLFSSLAKFESGFKPDVTYTEKFADSKGVRVVSRGLFQVSKGSGNQARYGCGIGKEEELHDAKTNIVCAVKIATFLINDNHTVAGGESPNWKGMARYWSPFRDAAKRKVIFDKARATCK